MKDNESRAVSGAQVPSAADPAIDSGTTKKIADVKSKLHSVFGQVVLAMASVPRYRHMMLSELQSLVIDPLVKDRIVLAFPTATDQGGQASTTPATVAIWASVSVEADKRIREQISAGVFPIRLKAEDWTSGDIVWLLDVIAPVEKMATRVLKGFRHVAKTDQVNIHPIVGKLVDRDTLAKLLSKPAGEKEGNTLN